MSTVDDDNRVANWWNRFRDHGDMAAREKLIEYHIPLVRHIAETLRSRLYSSPTVNIDDLVSAGHLGLVNAVDNFNPARGVVFSTYGWIRIRGAMLDELRQGNWVPRSIGRRARLFDQASWAVRSRLGRAPTETELKQELNVSPREYARCCRYANPAKIISIHNISGCGGVEQQDNDEWALPPSQKEPPPDRSAIQHDLWNVMLREMNRGERSIIVRYYYQGALMKDIAQTLFATTFPHGRDAHATKNTAGGGCATFPLGATFSQTRQRWLGGLPRSRCLGVFA